MYSKTVGDVNDLIGIVVAISGKYMKSGLAWIARKRLELTFRLRGEANLRVSDLQAGPAEGPASPWTTGTLRSKKRAAA